MQNNADLFRFIKICVIAAVGRQLDESGIEFSEDQNNLIDNIVDNIQVKSPDILEGDSIQNYIFNKTIQAIRLIDYVEANYKEE